MIGCISGKVLAKNQNSLWIMPNSGVGYRVDLGIKATKFSFGDEIKLFLAPVFKENSQELYGFEDFQDLEIFEKLLTVSGVGGRIALSIVNQFSFSEILTATDQASIEFFTAVPGIGKKLASKIILELKGKLVINETESKLLSGELINALRQLGFKTYELKELPDKIDSSQELSAQIAQALKILGKQL